MARGYLDFSPLMYGKTNDKTGQYYAQAIENVGKNVSDFAQTQVAQKQQLYNKIEEDKRSFNDFTNQKVTEIGQAYVDKINQENIELLKKNRFILTPQTRAQIQNNFAKIDGFVSKMKSFEDGAKASYNEYNTLKGQKMYEDPTPIYQGVLDALQTDEKGNYNEAAFNSAMDVFYNTETGKPALNVKPIAPDEYIASFIKTFQDKHKGEQLAPRFETGIDPKLGAVKWQVYETPVDYTNFDSELVNTLAADDQSQQLFKFVNENLSEEEKNIAQSKYGHKDDFGRLDENPLLSYMMYYAKEKLGIDKYKTNIVKKQGLSVIEKPKPTEAEEREAELLNKPTSKYNFGGYEVKQGIVNTAAKNENWTIKAPREVLEGGAISEPGGDVSYETMNFNVASIDEESGTAVLSQNTTNKNGEIVPKYYVIDVRGNEDLFKKKLGKERYNKMMKSANLPNTQKEYDEDFSVWKEKYKTRSEIIHALKQYRDAGKMTYYDYAEFLRRANQVPEPFSVTSFKKLK